MGSYPYFIELRLGHVDPKVRQIVRDVQHRFRLGRACHRVPHMTLFGPFDLKPGHGLREVQHAVETSAGNNHELPFVIDGWDHRTTPHGHVIGFRVDPSMELQGFRRSLSGRLCPIAVTKNRWDCDRQGGWFHITLAYHLREERTYRHVWDYVNGHGPTQNSRATSFLSRLLSMFFGRPRSTGDSIRPLYFPTSALRVSILKGDRILREYDLVQRRWLTREESLDGREYARTLRHYRKSHGFELTAPNHAHGPTAFVIGDLHLGHTNIIRYCARPFPSKNVREMDEVLIRNWNHRVRPTDTEYFLGDLAFGDGLGDEYMRRLNGEITFIRGNHDNDSFGGAEELRIRHSDYEFLLTHDPMNAKKPDGFSGWVIHGHTHNNDLKRYPFFDAANRKINVSAEVIGYQPVPLLDLVALIQARSDSIPTICDC